jgi:hypothetical protein
MNRYSKIFLVLVLVTLASSTALADDVGFTGNYSPGNFTSSGGGSIDTSGAPNSIVIHGNNNGFGGNTTFTTTAVYNATISFNWSYFTSDTDGGGFDFPFYVVLNGQNILCCDQFYGNGSGSGTISFQVNAGDTFGWGVNSYDGLFGAGHLTISNFKSVGDVPEPASLIPAGNGIGGSRRVTA